jgi:hypothetical protein
MDGWQVHNLFRSSRGVGPARKALRGRFSDASNSKLRMVMVNISAARQMFP